jgi:glycosyltransferase involved in cell wall biosynthesis
MPRVLIISGDTINENMAGMGMRYWELAHALAAHCQVTLAIPNPTGLSSAQVQVVSFDLRSGDLKPCVVGMDVIVLQGNILHFHPYLRELGVPLAVDLYVPNLLESLVWHDRDDQATWQPAYEEYLRVQLELLRAGDFFFCASERQRDYWLGWLHAQKRLNPHTYRQDPTFRRLIDIVPFGMPSERPVATRAVLKGVHPGIAPTDRVVLWSGGLWDWLDPLTLIRAVAQLTATHPELKLYFMGTRHPNSVVQGMSMPEQAADLARDLGLIDRTVFFGDWVPYNERVNYLLEADLAVVSHLGHIETHFSFRTRVLDCIWTGLPLVITEGDLMAEWVQSYHLGLTVPAADVNAMAVAIDCLLASGRQALASSFDSLRDSLAWSKVIHPLVQFCLHPAPAPDKGLYLTESERVSQAKDAFIEQVSKEKDAFYEQAIQQIIRERDEALERYRRMLPLRIYAKLKHLLGQP